MALVLNDRVKETTTTTGTGTLTLGGAVTGFETFAAGIGNSNTTYYAVILPGSAEFEVGLGTLNSDSSTIARTTIISSSNSDNAVNFSAGTKNIFCTIPASKSVFLDASGNTSVGADLSVGDDLTVEGGVISFRSNSGSPASLRMYCEVSNAHFQTLQPQPHAASAANTLRLPNSGDSGTQDLVAVDITQTLTNKTLTAPTITGTAVMADLDISGDVDVDGTLEADAITVNGTALNTVIAGVTVTNATNATNSTNSSHVLVTDNESTDEENLITFVEDATSSTGNVGLEMDGNLTYNPSTGRLSATQLTGTLQTAAQTNITSVGTLSSLTTSGNIELGHASDTTLARSSAGVVTIEGNTIITTGNSDTPPTTTSSSDADFVLVDDGGTMKKITPANLGITSGSASKGFAVAMAIAL